jgi:DNA-binding NtrC family response regulator
VARHQGTILALQSFRDAMALPPEAAPAERIETDAAGASDSWLQSEQLPTLQQAEERLIAEALRRAGGNQGVAAGLLGISRQALNKRLSRQRQSGDSDDE